MGSVGIAFIMLFAIGKLIIKTGDVTWLAFLLVYGVDGCLTIIHQLIKRKGIGRAHRKHAYQLMANELEMNHVVVSVIYMTIQLIISLVMIYLVPDTLEAHWTYVIVVALVLSVAYILFMKKYYYLYELYLRRLKQKTCDKITQTLLERLTSQAKASPELQMNYELGNAAKGLSQRTLNAIEPESVVPIHRHQKSSETVVCLRGRLVVEFYDVLERRCIETQELSPNGALIALNITEGQWHTVRALESGTVVLLVKDGRYEAIKQTLVYTNGHYELVRN